MGEVVGRHFERGEMPIELLVYEFEVDFSEYFRRFRLQQTSLETMLRSRMIMGFQYLPKEESLLMLETWK
eukprot:scaffold85006_cov63-Attheya_sp.AAC.4